MDDLRINIAARLLSGYLAADRTRAFHADDQQIEECWDLAGRLIDCDRAHQAPGMEVTPAPAPASVSDKARESDPALTQDTLPSDYILSAYPPEFMASRLLARRGPLPEPPKPRPPGQRLH